MLPVLLALGAAVLYAAASILQQRAAAEEPAEHSLRIGLLTRLVRRPLWLLGILADIAAFGLQFAALAEGTLVLVQPLLVVGLLFALPIEAKLSKERITAGNVAAALAVCAGLAIFLVVADPAPGRSFVRAHTWLALLTAGCGTAFVLAQAGQRARGQAKAILLSASAGVVYGIAAGLTKTTGQLLANGVLSAFGHWEVYALVAVGIGGLVVGASAFQAGRLDVSLPTMSVLDPVVSVLVGALAFRESMAASPGALAAEVGGLVLTAVGIFALARSPAISARGEHHGAVPPPAAAP